MTFIKTQQIWRQLKQEARILRYSTVIFETLSALGKGFAVQRTESPTICTGAVDLPHSRGRDCVFDITELQGTGNYRSMMTSNRSPGVFSLAMRNNLYMP